MMPDELPSFIVHILHSAAKGADRELPARAGVHWTYEPPKT